MQLNLRAAREARGWTLAELARRSGVHKSTVSRLERGEIEPSLRTVEKLEAALGLARGEIGFFDATTASVGTGDAERH